MSGAEERFPRRFRRRLALTFMAVTALAGGVLALVSFVLAREYRIEGFETRAHREAELNLGLSAGGDQASLDGLVSSYREFEGFEVVIGGIRRPLSSRNDLGLASVPEQLLSEVRSQRGPAVEVASASADVNGTRYLVVGGAVPRSSAEAYFFFSLQEVLDSLSAIRTSLLVGWVLVALAAALVGQLVARRTLRPVRHAADAARSLAEGLLDTRLSVATDDEFGAWATHFNQMADALADKIEALSEATDRERRFSADVAHELRTPLSALANASSMLAADIDQLPAQTRRPMELVVEGVTRLRRLVEDLLELSRLDSGQQAVTLERLTLGDAIAATVRAGGWEDVVRVVAAPATVVTDRHRLDRVIGNLISNAVVHGGGPVTVSIGQSVAEVTVTVTDTGPGMTDEALAHVFDRFAKASTGPARAGSGLGLAIASENARLLGGAIRVASAPGEGAAFTLVLPRRDDHEPATWDDATVVTG